MPFKDSRRASRLPDAGPEPEIEVADETEVTGAEAVGDEKNLYQIKADPKSAAAIKTMDIIEREFMALFLQIGLGF